MLTLNMEYYPIEVPVDTQAASAKTNDRRKRNASALARFRRRRKEKEHEMSSTISRLEQRLRDVTAEREFYGQERDHFQRLVAVPGGYATALAPRPFFPSSRRRSMPAEMGLDMAAASPSVSASP